MTLSPLVSEWPEDARSHYEERAAIREYLGREPRDRAERAAEAEVRARWPVSGPSSPQE